MKARAQQVIVLSRRLDQWQDREGLAWLVQIFRAAVALRGHFVIISYRLQVGLVPLSNFRPREKFA
jgi:hypothetical protein